MEGDLKFILLKTIFIIFLLTFSLYSQEISTAQEISNSAEESNTTDDKYNSYKMFVRSTSDRYYTGWLDTRSFVSRVFLNYNFDVKDLILERDPDFNMDFKNVHVFFDTRVASEFIFFRNNYISVGPAAALDALLYISSELVDGASFFLYDMSGEFTAYVDLYLKEWTGIDIKIRICPFFHQSTHFVDGYRADFSGIKGASYEFFQLNTYYYKNIGLHSITAYGGFEATYRYMGIGAPLFKAQVGLDYRYLLSEQYQISLITGLNVAYVYDSPDTENLATSQSSPLVVLGFGVEFYSFVTSIKYKYGRVRGATTYFDEQSSLGLELSVLF